MVGEAEVVTVDDEEEEETSDDDLQVTISTKRIGLYPFSVLKSWCLLFSCSCD